MEMDNVTKFMLLKAKNPDMPVIPYVYSGIVSDHCVWRYAGSIGESSIKSYVYHRMYGQYDEIVTSENIGTLKNYLMVHTVMTEKEVDDYINNLDWKEAIFLYIDPPQEAAVQNLLKNNK